jgi:exodeoxyribonuclease V alpha subunit
MVEEENIKCKITITTNIYYNEDGCFGIAVGTISDIEQGNVADGIDITIKGNMPSLQTGIKYSLVAKPVTDKKYGLQYQIVSIGLDSSIAEDDMEGKKNFLSSLFVESQIAAMYDVLKDPFKTLEEEDVQSLVKVKGCGIKTAAKWIKRFQDHYDMARMYVALQDYGVSYSVVKKLQDFYHSSDIAIQRVKDNPYLLVEVCGIGWKTCDKIAQCKGMPEFSKERVEAYISFYLEDAAQNGYSYVPVDYNNEQLLDIKGKGNSTINLMDAIIGEIGEGVPDTVVSEAVKDMGDKLWWNNEHTLIGLKKYYDLEYKIGQELIRLRNCENTFKYDGWEEIVKADEAKEGIEYTDQQMEAIKSVLENQVSLTVGVAGSGKTTIVKEILNILPNYEFAQVALAGRAANRMSEVTGKEGSTIHRLLGFPKGDDKDFGFVYTAENKLPYDMIILDEISMVDGYLFYDLIRAIKDGAKLIMLGDIGQLESIGCLNIAYDLIKSDEISSSQLTKIHRQAENSAIITESIKARHGEQLIPKDWFGTETRGKLQDLTIECYSDPNNTYYRIMEYFSRTLEEVKNIMDIQIIVPIKEKQAGTWSINRACQELYNPSEEGKKELEVYYDPQHRGVLRVGDKVINMSNNYNTSIYRGQWDIPLDADDEESDDDVTPIYNGNLGIIKAIHNRRREMIIDFKGIGEILIKSDSIKNIQLAYAITCHKMQGSEVAYTIVGIDFSSFTLLTKEWIYTALTRASKHCTLLAQNRALRYAVMQNGVIVKQTHLVQVLNDLTHPTF